MEKYTTFMNRNTVNNANNFQINLFIQHNTH